ncbi:hypothetical protein LR69_03771 [Geobacillus sp. BCO2]|nr:hypothetical protein LR69_03771 [Geobacillus sp. BCO2]
MLKRKMIQTISPIPEELSSARKLSADNGHTKGILTALNKIKS